MSLSDELADASRLHRSGRERLLVVAHQQSGLVGVGQPPVVGVEDRQQVRLVLGALDLEQRPVVVGRHRAVAELNRDLAWRGHPLGPCIGGSEHDF